MQILADIIAPTAVTPYRTDRQVGPMGKYWLHADRYRQERTGGEAMLVALMHGKVVYTTGCYGLKVIDRPVWFIVPPEMDYSFHALSDAMLIYCHFDMQYLLSGQRFMTRFARRASRALPIFHYLPLQDRLYDYLNLADIFLRIGELHGGIERKRDEIFEMIFTVYRRRHLAPVFRAVFDPPPIFGTVTPDPIK